jgi:uncharacterized protein YndB with AHSA1/START domain
MTEISAAGAVSAPAAAVFDFLADLRNHWALSRGRIAEEGSSLDPSRGGQVRMRGPLGIRRRAQTEVIAAEPPSLLRGRAVIGARTVADLEWRLSESTPDETLVELRAVVKSSSAVDSFILRAGGARWLERLFACVLNELSDHAPAITEVSAMAVP